MRVLPDYVNYIAGRGGRSFIQYFGCHSVPLRWKFSSNVYFVVMRNFLPVKSWLTFDLKGATANRRVPQLYFLSEMLCVRWCISEEMISRFRKKGNLFLWRSYDVPLPEWRCFLERTSSPQEEKTLSTGQVARFSGV